MATNKGTLDKSWRLFFLKERIVITTPPENRILLSYEYAKDFQLNYSGAVEFFFYVLSSNSWTIA